MAYDKVVDSGKLDSALSALANSIRNKGNTTGNMGLLNGEMKAAVDALEVAAVSYSVEEKTETWQHNSYVTISVDIGEDGSVSAYKSSGSGTANNMVICYPQSDTWSADSEITRIPFPHEEGEHTIPVTIWWDNQNGAHQDSNNHTLTYTVVKKSAGSVDVQPLRVITNGTYTAPEGTAYSPVSVNVPVPVTKNVQAYHGMGRSNSTSLASVDVRLTVAKTGTYKVSWMGVRSSTSGTSSSQLYIGGTAYGTASTTFDTTNGYSQSVVLDNVSLTEGQMVEVRARARSTSYFMSVGNLVIEEQ